MVETSLAIQSDTDRPNEALYFLSRSSKRSLPQVCVERGVPVHLLEHEREAREALQRALRSWCPATVRRQRGTTEKMPTFNCVASADGVLVWRRSTQRSRPWRRQGTRASRARPAAATGASCRQRPRQQPQPSAAVVIV